MVRKLYKYEIRSYLRVWIPLQILLLVVALFARFLQLFESETLAYNLINVSSILAFAVAVIAATGLTLIFSVVRFYKNLFTTEGYLSFTLPVSPATHLWVKLSTAAAFQVATFAVVLLAAGVITAGDVCYEVIKALAYVWSKLWEQIGWHLLAYVLEFAVLALVAVFVEILLYYTCLSVGQLARKNRILMAVGVYFGYYLISQAFSTVVAVVVTVIPPLFWEQITVLLENYATELVHVALCGYFVWYVVLGSVYTLITWFILRNKLNLE